MSEATSWYLVETDWLQDHLDDPNLRVLDCTVFLRPVEGGGVRPESGRTQWEQAHIPGAGFADLLGDLSDRNTTLPLMMPPPAQFADAMTSYGVGDHSRVVLYDAGMNMWAARVWWMLRAFGFERAAVLNGGWAKWTAEGRPASSGSNPAPRTHFTPRVQQGRIARWKEVLAATSDPTVRLVNALSAEEHAGRITRVARPGHIPGSVNVPASSLVDQATNAYLDVDALRDAFEKTGALGSQRVITYCGGGIAACSDALVLTMLGVTDVAVYDGSLVEWSARPELPLQSNEG